MVKKNWNFTLSSSGPSVHWPGHHDSVEHFQNWLSRGQNKQDPDDLPCGSAIPEVIKKWVFCMNIKNK